MNKISLIDFHTERSCFVYQLDSPLKVKTAGDYHLSYFLEVHTEGDRLIVRTLHGRVVARSEGIMSHSYLFQSCGWFYSISHKWLRGATTGDLISACRELEKTDTDVQTIRNELAWRAMFSNTDIGRDFYYEVQRNRV